MVISHLFGGLGNQLFQYAAGKCIAGKYQVPLALDTSAFAGNDHRKFDLEYLHTDIRIATPGEIDQLKPRSNLDKVLQLMQSKHKRTYHRERSYIFDRSFNSIGPDVYLKGYFQCLPYFESIEPLLRKEFIVKDEYVSHLAPLAAELSQPGSVAIHIRRGDYAKKEVQQLLAHADAAWYREAIALMNRTVSNPSYFFFSDDINWVKENLALPGARYVSGIETKTHIEDFYLLGKSANQVIPNSTFAWWAAWLNPNPGKKVIMPAKWFNDDSQNRDRTPAGWITL